MANSAASSAPVRPPTSADGLTDKERQYIAKACGSSGEINSPRGGLKSPLRQTTTRPQMEVRRFDFGFGPSLSPYRFPACPLPLGLSCHLQPPRTASKAAW